ncbi:MAG: MATE family efflux transporter, partial [Pseudomonadota bacterium]
MADATPNLGEDSPSMPPPVEFDRRLIEGAIVPTLITFALPLVGTNLLHSIAGSYMAGWVGQIIGPNGLTAVVIVNVLVWMMLISAVMGVASASSILIAQAYGAGRQDQLKTITGTSVAFVLVASIMMSLIGWFGSPLFVDLISTPEAARDLAITYLRSTAISVLAVFPLVFITIMIRGVGDAKTPFRFTVLWIVLSMLFIPVVLLAPFGLPKLGIAGVAHCNT